MGKLGAIFKQINLKTLCYDSNCISYRGTNAALSIYDASELCLHLIQLVFKIFHSFSIVHLRSFHSRQFTFQRCETGKVSVPVTNGAVLLSNFSFQLLKLTNCSSKLVAQLFKLTV